MLVEVQEPTKKQQIITKTAYSNKLQQKQYDNQGTKESTDSNINRRTKN